MKRRVTSCMIAVVLVLAATGRDLADAASDGLRDAAVLTLGNDSEGCVAHPAAGAATAAGGNRGLCWTGYPLAHSIPSVGR